jgi:hypothetical protein
MVNQGVVDGHDRLMARVAKEQDDILGAVQLVQGDDALQERLFDQLVDLLVESLFLDLRQQYIDLDVTRERYVEEISRLADRCRDVGLLPLPTRDG